MTDVFMPDWRSEQRQQLYPFADNATMGRGSSQFITDAAFVDAVLYPIGATLPLYLSKVTIAFDTVTLEISDATRKLVASGSFAKLSPPGQVELADANGVSAGLLVSEAGSLAEFQGWDIGTYVFTVDQTPFVTDVCQSLPAAGVRGFVLDDGTVLHGDVWLLGDNGVVLRAEQAEEFIGCGNSVTYDVIRVDIVGDPLFRRKLCDPFDLFSTPRFLRELVLRQNGGCHDVSVIADPGGDVRLTAVDRQADLPALRISSQNNGIIMQIAGKP